MNTETTELTVVERAAVALGSSKAALELTELAAKSKSIVAITNPDGRTECHSAAMTAKAARINVEKAGKAARDDSTAFSKAVIAEEKRLVDLIAPEESRLIALRDAWDSKIAKEKAEKAEAERQRIDAIRIRINNIINWPAISANGTSKALQDDINRLQAMEIDDSFKEFYGEACEARSVALEKLREIHAAKVHAESEAIRIKAEQDEQFARLKSEREELERMKKEQERIAHEADARRRAEFEALEKGREELRKAQQLIDAQKDEERAEAEREQAEKAAAEKNIYVDAAVAELSRLAAENQSKVVRHEVKQPEPITLISSMFMPDSKIGELTQFLINENFTDAELDKQMHYAERQVIERQKAAA